MIARLFIFGIINLCFLKHGVCQVIAEEADYSLIFETEFEFKLEDAHQVNFHQFLTANGVDRAETKAILWKQDLSQSSPPAVALYLSHFLKQHLLTDSIPYEIDASWIAKSGNQPKELFKTVDTIINVAAITTVHGISRPWTNYKIKQRWYYKESTQKLSNQVISISPIFEIKQSIARHSKGDSILWKKEERIKMYSNGMQDAPTSNTNLLNDEDITWMKQTTTAVSFDQVKILKGSKAQFRQIFWEDILTFKNIAHLKKSNDQSTILFSQLALAEMQQSSTDTMLLIHPETYEEQIIVKKYIPPNFAAICAYRIHQIWYFNRKTYQLESKLIRIGPLVRNHFDHQLKELYFINQN